MKKINTRSYKNVKDLQLNQIANDTMKDEIEEYSVCKETL